MKAGVTLPKAKSVPLTVFTWDNYSGKVEEQEEGWLVIPSGGSLEISMLFLRFMWLFVFSFIPIFLLFPSLSFTHFPRVEQFASFLPAS